MSMTVQNKAALAAVAVVAVVAMVVVVAFLVAVKPSPNQTVFLPPWLFQTCEGTLVVEVSNDNLFVSVSYEVVVFQYGENLSAYSEGHLFAGETERAQWTLSCGSYSAAVSWNGGPWHPKDISIDERGEVVRIAFRF